MQPASVCEAAPAIQPRRRLAENVVCLFAEDRPAISNPRWRGRLPRNVLRFHPAPPLGRGDLVAVLHGDNAGRLVRVLCREFKKGTEGFARGYWCYVDAGADVLRTIDIDSGESDPQPQRRCYFKEGSLRRVREDRR